MGMDHVLKIIGDYWDDYSSVFDMNHDTEDIELWKKTLEELLGKDKNKNVLDLGTGTGFLANMTAQLGYATIGMDISREMMKYAVRHAERKNTSAFYMEGSASELPFMENSVDCIMNARLIWTLAEPEQALKEWIRVLKPGGKILCFNRMKEGVGMTRYVDDFYKDKETEESLKIQTAGMDELKDLLSSCGYTDVEIRKLPGLTLPEYDYEPWFVLMGTKPEDRRLSEAEGMAEYWDDSASWYESEHEVDHKEVWEELLEKFIGEKKEIRILDAASGTGILTNMLGKIGYKEITGMDLSEQMTRIAVRHAEEQGNTNVRFKYGNVIDTEYPDESFDVITSSRLLWTLTEPEAAIKEWMRILKPGGKLIAINELEPGDGIRCGNMEQYREATGTKEMPYGNVKQDKILEDMKQAGFKEVQLQHMPGCHLHNSSRENWYAFTGVKQ